MRKANRGQRLLGLRCWLVGYSLEGDIKAWRIVGCCHHREIRDASAMPDRLPRKRHRSGYVEFDDRFCAAVTFKLVLCNACWALEIRRELSWTKT